MPIKPKMNKAFWSAFDRGLAQRLDDIDAGKANPRFDIAGLFVKPQFSRALVTASLAVMVVSFTLMLSAGGRPGLISVASLTNDELAEELVLIEASGSQEIVVDF